MSPIGLILTVVAAAGWSGLDISRKVLVGRMNPEPVLVWLVAGQSVLFAAWAIYEGTWVQSLEPYVLPALGSVALNSVANLTYLHAVRLSPFSVMIPLLSLVPVFTVAAANPLLGELPSTQQLVGITVVVAGTLALGAGPCTDGSKSARGPVGMFVALLRERGTLPMLVTALLWALTIVVDKLAMKHASAGAHGLVLNVGVGIAMLGWMAARRRLGELSQIRGNGRMLLAAIGAGSVGLGAQLLAIGYLLAGVVEAIKRALGIVVAVAVGRIAFSEPVTRPKVAAVVLMSIGVALIVV